MIIQDVLYKFFQAPMIDNPPNGYPSSAPFARFILNPGDTIPSGIPLSDDQWVKVDLTLSNYRLSHPEHYAILEMFYGNRQSDSRISRFLRCDRTTVWRKRKGAEAFLENRLGFWSDPMDF